jgi:hypothetical protein
MPNGRASLLINPDRLKRHFLDRSRITPYPHRNPKQSGPRRDLTLCIAASCNGGRNIVTASDLMISTFDMSSDNSTLKRRAVGYGWYAMFAGNDLSPLTPIFNDVWNAIPDTPDGSDLPEVVSAFTEAYKQELKAKIEREILSNWNIRLDRFVAEGAKLFKADFYSINNRVMNTKLDCQFLVCGFDKKKEWNRLAFPHIFTIGGNTYGTTGGVEICYCDYPPYAAIGSGASTAYSMLLYFGHNIGKSLSETIYTVVASKIMGERAAHVGRKTVVNVIDSVVGYEFNVGELLEEKIRDAWDTTGKPQIPDACLGELDQLIQRNYRPLLQPPKKSD